MRLQCLCGVKQKSCLELVEEVTSIYVLVTQKRHEYLLHVDREENESITRYPLST